MNQRTLLLVGMWALALVAVVAVQWAKRPAPGTEVHSLRAPRSAPVWDAPAETPLEGPSRRDLAVEEVAEGRAAFYRGDRRHSGRSPYAGPTEGVLRFAFDTGGRVVAQPVISASGRVYVASLSGSLYVLDRRGNERWQRNLGGAVYSTPYVARDGRAYVGSDAGYLYAFDAQGAPLFKLATEGEADTGVVPGPDGTLYFAAGRALFAIDPEGKVLWRFRARSKIFTTPAVDADGTIYVGAQDDRLYAIAPDGTQRWAFRAAGDIDASPLIGDDGSIYFGSDGRRFYALDRDGKQRFQVRLQGMIRAPAAQGRDGSLLVGTLGPRPAFYALDPEDGSERWSFAVAPSDSRDLGVMSGALVDREGRIYFGAHDGFLYALSPKGELLFHFRAGADIDTPPVLSSDGTLYFGSDNGQLYAIGDAH